MFRELFGIASSPVSAAAIDAAFLAPAMDARVHNLDQYDPSAAVDSALERIQALALRLPPSPEREELLLEVERCIDSNVEEAYAELAMCGDADQLVTDLRFAERNGNREVLGAKAIARHLRPALDVLADVAGRPVAEIVDARALVRGVVAEVPRLMLLSRAVERELGAQKFGTLLDLTEKSGAARSNRDAAKTERGPARHAEL